MPLSTNVSVLRGATAFTPTGGAANVYVNDGRGSNGRKQLVNSTNTNILLRESLVTNLVIGYIEPNANTNAKLYRAEIVAKEPFQSAALRNYNPGWGFNMSFHPEETEANRVQRLNNAIAVISNAALVALFTKGVHD